MVNIEDTDMVLQNVQFKLKNYINVFDRQLENCLFLFGKNFTKRRKEKYMETVKKKYIKLIKIVTALLMVFSLLYTVTVDTKAWDNTIPHEFTRVKEIKYPEWWGRKVPGLSSWSTFSTKYNGRWAYCLESSKNTPDEGSYVADVIENNAAVRKLLFYGFGGPSPYGEFADGYDLKKAICPDDSYLSNDDTKYLLTHIFLSGAYSNDWNGFDEEKFNQVFGGVYGTNIMNIYRRILELPEPDYARFNPSNSADGTEVSFTGKLDENKTQQITNTVSFQGGNNSTINISLADNMTIHVDGATQTGGTATVRGGQSFYFTAPCLNAPEDMENTDVTGTGCEKFTALAIRTGGGNNQVEGSWDMDPDENRLYIQIDWMEFGSIEITKTNTNADLIDGAIFNLKSVSFEGYDENITVNNGKLKVDNLPIGTYELKEIQAPDGYLLNKTVYTLTVNKDQTTTQTVINEEPTGLIDLIKEINSDLTDGNIGDAFLQGNEYTLKAKEKITNKAGTVTYFEKDAVVDTQLTDKQGKLTFDNLHVGKYYIEESKSNESLVLNPNDIDVSIEYAGQNVSKILRSTNTDNRVNMQKIQIHKFGEKDSESGILNGLAGAEFTFKLKSEVDQIGWDNAKTYDVITTDKNGKATTKYLPYGKYLVKETKTPQDYMTAPDFTVSITKDYSEYEDIEQIKVVDINNRPYTSQLKLVKKDLDSGKTVTLNSATFKVKAREDIVSNGKVIYQAGDTIKQKISGKWYDSFTTSADNVVVPDSSFEIDGEMGSVVLPLQLDAGKYYIDEIKTPAGYLALENRVEFDIENIHDYDKDEDNDPILEVVVKNDKPVGSLEVYKDIKSYMLKPVSLKDENIIADESFVDMSDVSKIKFKLTAKENVTDPADGSVIYAKGTVVGEYSLPDDGILKVDNLPMGIYELQETTTLDGLVLDTAKYTVKFEQTDLTTKVYKVSLDLINYPTVVEISKTDVTGQKEIEGAKMQLLDENRNIIAQWISGNRPYVVEGLTVGEKYILKEDLAPLGYVQASEIEFVIENTSEIQKVKMTDKVLTVRKADAIGNAVEGTVLQVVSAKTKNIVDQWIVDESGNHNVNGLIVGESYILKELQAPEGYILADDVKFTVTDDNQNQVVKMNNYSVKAVKQDESGKLLKGAVLEAVDLNTNEVIDRWTSGEHIFNINEDIKEKLLSGQAVESMLVSSKDDSSTRYKIIPNEKNNDFSLMLQANGETKYFNIDIDGNETSHLIRNLKENQKYQVIETVAPEGYATIQPLSFIANKDITLSLVDKLTKVEISKLDITTNQELPGAHLILEDITDGKCVLVEKWVSGNEAHMIKGLIVGHKYRLTEKIAPQGYQLAKAIEFEVEDTGEVQKIIMYDELSVVPKTGDSKNSILYGGMAIISTFALFLLKQTKKRKREN